jgi:hypothetical protein
LKWSLTIRVRREIAADQAGSSNRKTPGTSGYDAEDFRKLQTETGAAKRSPTETQKLGSRLGTDFQRGRHGFDGNGCGQEACRGSRTLNRVKKTQLPTTNWLTQLN